ncbi:MAG TPA: PEP-CTERM sorting domain-containing protein [Fimbriiglobus sp.]|nr:PEP-CTERM sorting domain-containing protein [Fimbriiglobus sp.]
MRTDRRVWLLCGLVASATAGAARGQESILQFNGGLVTGTGPAAASFFNGVTTQSAVGFGSASSFSLPALPGGDAQVLHAPALMANQGIVFQPNAAANGGGTKINQYTIGYDILFAATPSFAVFHNITADVAAGTVTGDGDLFRRGSDMGIGISGQYDGVVSQSDWHRVVITMNTTEGAQGTMRKYIDGTLVSAQTTLDNGGLDLRFAIDPAAPGTNGLVLLNDDDGESSEVYLNSFYFNNVVLTDAQVQAFGVPTVAGFAPVPEPGAVVAVAAAGLGLAGAVRRRRRAAA